MSEIIFQDSDGYTIESAEGSNLRIMGKNARTGAPSSVIVSIHSQPEVEPLPKQVRDQLAGAGVNTADYYWCRAAGWPMRRAAADAISGWYAERQAELRAEQTDELQKKFPQQFAEAQQTGKPVAIETWVTDRCMNRNSDECSFDNATTYILPSGTTKTTYRCCH